MLRVWVFGGWLDVGWGKCLFSLCFFLGEVLLVGSICSLVLVLGWIWWVWVGFAWLDSCLDLGVLAGWMWVGVSICFP